MLLQPGLAERLGVVVVAAVGVVVGGFAPFSVEIAVVRLDSAVGCPAELAVFVVEVESLSVVALELFEDLEDFVGVYFVGVLSVNLFPIKHFGLTAAIQQRSFDKNHLALH